MAKYELWLIGIVLVLVVALAAFPVIQRDAALAQVYVGGLCAVLASGITHLMSAYRDQRTRDHDLALRRATAFAELLQSHASSYLRLQIEASGYDAEWETYRLMVEGPNAELEPDLAALREKIESLRDRTKRLVEMSAEHAGHLYPTTVESLKKLADARRKAEEKLTAISDVPFVTADEQEFVSEIEHKAMTDYVLELQTRGRELLDELARLEATCRSATL